MGFERHLLFIQLHIAESLQLYLSEELAARRDFLVLYKSQSSSS